VAPTDFRLRVSIVLAVLRWLARPSVDLLEEQGMTMRFDDTDQREAGAERIDLADRRAEDGGSSRPRAWNQAAVFRFLGLGTELAGFTLGCAGLGYLIDLSAGFPKPYATAAGALIGFTLGMIRFVVQVRRSDND
jgi:F0F1-type ATP synthase assembly protein I